MGHKSSHKSKKSHRQSGKSIDKELSLESLLCSGLLTFPEILNELPLLISELDKGQFINTKLIENSEALEFVENLFQSLSTVDYDAKRGCWVKKKDVTSIRESIFIQLLKSNSIENPLSLSLAKKCATNAASIYFDILLSFPSLKDEMIDILNSLIDGNLIDLDDIENEDVKDILLKLFKSFNLTYQKESRGTGYGIKNYDANQNISQEAMKMILKSVGNIKKSKRITRNEATSKRKDDNSIKLEDDDASNSSESSNTEGNPSVDDESDEDDDNANRMNKQGEKVTRAADNSRNIGPTMPTPAQLQEAQLQIEIYQQQRYTNTSGDISSNSDEEEVGPLPLSTATSQSTTTSTSLQQTPLGGVFPMSQPFSHQDIEGGRGSSTQSKRKREGEKEVREEWMLTPGESKGAEGITEAFGVSRTFQSGKTAKKAAAELAAQKERQLKVTENSEESQRTEAILEEYRAMRGPSLMDQHTEKQIAKKPIKEERKVFDRERDVLSRRNLGSKEARELVEQAKKLDSRFDKGTLQRTFL